jgi:cellulose synthase/poly-beta-1,6-N-acetylglucosamine synthase-like glycosyltransferase
LGLSYPNFELVLCAGGEDGTEKIASEYQAEKLILLEQQPGEGKQHSLQRGLEKDTGEIIYLTDADCQISDAVFAWTLAPIINQDEEVVSGSRYTTFPEQLQNPFVINQCAARLYAAIYQTAFSYGLQGRNSAVSRKALEQVGAFRTEVRTGTDYDLAKRLLQQRFRIRYEMNASIMNELPTGIGPYFRQQAHWARNVVMHGLRFEVYSEVLTCLCTFLVGLGMLFIPFLALFLSFFPGIPGLVAFLSLYLVSFWMLARVWRRSWDLTPLEMAGKHASFLQSPAATRALVLGLGGGLLAHALYGLTDAVALGAKPGILFWMLLGLIEGCMR